MADKPSVLIVGSDMTLIHMINESLSPSFIDTSVFPDTVSPSRHDARYLQASPDTKTLIDTFQLYQSTLKCILLATGDFSVLNQWMSALSACGFALHNGKPGIPVMALLNIRSMHTQTRLLFGIKSDADYILAPNIWSYDPKYVPVQSYVDKTGVHFCSNNNAIYNSLCVHLLGKSATNQATPSTTINEVPATAEKPKVVTADVFKQRAKTLKVALMDKVVIKLANDALAFMETHQSSNYCIKDAKDTFICQYAAEIQERMSALYLQFKAMYNVRTDQYTVIVSLV